MARGDQLSRQWKIIQALIASRRGKTVPELAQMVECHTRTLYRDLEALQAAGFPVMTEREGHRMVWSLFDSHRYAPPIALSLSELTALYFGRSLAAVLKGTVFHDALESLFAKIKALLPAQMLQHLDRAQESLTVAVSPAKPHAPYREMIELVSHAIVQRRCLDMVYRAMHGRTDTRRRVAPYRLLFFEGCFYVLGHCGLRQDIRVFALDRIQALDLSAETFRPLEGLNIDDFLKSSFGVFQGPPAHVKIRFHESIAAYITEKTWHPSQKVTTRPDGSVIFEADVAGTEEIKHWVLKWGSTAEVLEPDGLRQEIRREAEGMLKAYRR
jgi:predicted DNA-binding transcriptional regulator YafY